MHILLPKLALTFPILKSAGPDGGHLRPVDEQSDIVFSRIVTRLTSEKAQAMMLDPEIDEGRGQSSASASPVALRPPSNRQPGQDRGSYHIIVIDEPDADEGVIRKSIHPMLSFYAGSIVKIGTPGITRRLLEAINLNKRRMTSKRVRQNHFGSTTGSSPSTTRTTSASSRTRSAAT
jgi:hypothetical protein